MIAMIVPYPMKALPYVQQFCYQPHFKILDKYVPLYNVLSTALGYHRDNIL